VIAATGAICDGDVDGEDYAAEAGILGVLCFLQKAPQM